MEHLTDYERTLRIEPGAAVSPAGSLEGDLRRRIRGEVRFDEGSRAIYATDASNYREVPIGVVAPKDAEDVVAAIEVCRRHGAPVLSRGGGTSLAGQCCNKAVILDTTKYFRGVLELDLERRIARVLPGTILDDLRNLAEAHGLTFGPDPATHNHCSLGGMIGNNSCGVHALMAGKTVDNVQSLNVLTYDGLRLRVGPTSDGELDSIVRAGGRRGEIYFAMRALRDRYADLIRSRYPRIPRRVSGYNLDELLPENGFNVARALVGTEGTCVTVLEASLRLVDSPRGRALLVIGYPDVFQAADHLPEILEYGPIGLEGIDQELVRDMREKRLNVSDLELLPDGRGWLLVEFGGESPGEAEEKARTLMRSIRNGPTAPPMALYLDPEEALKVWEIRESGLGATARVPGMKDTWEGWEDSAVPPKRTGEYLRDLRGLLDRYGYHGALYGHFGQGCIHTRIDFSLRSEEGIRQFRAFKDDASDLVLRYGGSLSGEHGDGQARGELLVKMFGSELVGAFREFKRIWDPDGKMNPGKVVDADPITTNLRLSPEQYRPVRLKTRFEFPDDQGSFQYATERCVGVGECRRDNGGTMCPSYMVTREEMHSTRGRARILYEMTQGDVVKGGWRDEHVHEALDLCLSCKGCKSDCPVDVDMATYKAEFLSHYYEGRLRPRAAYAMGLIHWWARAASFAPGLVNWAGRAPVVSSIVKAAGGIAPQRKMPAFAPITFKAWLSGRPRRNAGGKPVILWPDTFNNHFHPQTSIAALEVLEDAGFDVEVPREALCCGRPLYDFGMLDLARKMLRRTLAVLEPAIEAGTPVVGLEPSCVSVFRDEMYGFFPDDPLARRLKEQTYTFSEFLEKKAPDYTLPRLEGNAIVHGHCHEKSVLDFDVEGKIFARMGLDAKVLDSGCCGMAGSFGFEKGEKYDISMKAGQRVLLPEVQSASPRTIVVADGFSCREQVAQGTARKALHLAEVIQLAKRAGPGHPGITPERALEQSRVPLQAPGRRRRLRRAGALLAFSAIATSAIAGALALRATTASAR